MVLAGCPVTVLAKLVPYRGRGPRYVVSRGSPAQVAAPRGRLVMSLPARSFG